MWECDGEPFWHWNKLPRSKKKAYIKKFGRESYFHNYKVMKQNIFIKPLTPSEFITCKIEIKPLTY